mmetsp:Transcript_3947/g.5202  ORF Transcript_3947/g.5202 Transcript_3947/m.5202 type:complete len:83 (+) Transcript_3947:1018-1266(+)
MDRNHIRFAGYERTSKTNYLHQCIRTPLCGFLKHTILGKYFVVTSLTTKAPSSGNEESPLQTECLLWEERKHNLYTRLQKRL